MTTAPRKTPKKTAGKSAARRKVFDDSITALPEAPGVSPRGLKVHAAGDDHAQDVMRVSFSFDLPAAHQRALESAIARGETVPAQALTTTYAVSHTCVKPLVAWLESQGFSDIEVAADRSSVYASATVQTVEKALQVDIVRVTQGGITFNAARTAPSLPADIGADVTAIGGLQPYRRLHRQYRRVTACNRCDGPAERSAKLKNKPKAAPAIANRPPFLAPEISQAYDAAGIKLTGKGQVIAILIDTVPSDDDMKAFWKKNKLDVKASQLTKINVAGGTLPPAEGEETLDAQWTSGIAPGADIRIYASGGLDFAQLDRALDRIIADLPKFPTMRQLSISLGLGETYMAPAELRVQHTKYLKLAAAGVNVFVSSGDAGSNPDDTGHNSTGPLQAEYPASDDAVVSVGGTTLKLKAGGGVMSEVGWPDGGGGKSQSFKRPAWQKAPGVASGTHRLVPDVSLTADPNQGALCVFGGQTQQIGGTSWSAPVWAGFCALVNEARAKVGKAALPFLNPLLYPLAGTAAFRDITSGSNGEYTAGKGFDLVTGLGVPNVKGLIKALG